MHANQGFLEGVKGGGVQHLLLDLCAVRAPIHTDIFIRVQEYNINVPGHTEGTGKYIGLPGHQEELLLLA